MKTLQQKENYLSGRHEKLIRLAMEHEWSICYNDYEDAYVVVIPTLDHDDETQCWVTKEEAE